MTSKEINIIEAIKNGDHRGLLSELYDTVLPKVRSYVTKNSGDVEEANDMFQDAVMVFYKQVKLNELNIKQSIEAYIFTVAKNLWINKAKRDARIQFTDEVKEDKGITFNSLHHLISDEREEAIKNVLGQLGERCAQLLNYIFYQDYSLVEVTEAMGFSSAEVTHTNHYRCKKKLMALVSGNESFKELLKSGING